jgi:hypothetical protein
MRFFLRRYGRALRFHQKWALLALPPLFLYLGLAAFYDVTFSVSQGLSPYSGDLPVAASDSPLGTVTLNALLADPDLLFLDGFALMQLQKSLGLIDHDAGLAGDLELRRAVHSTLALSTTGDTGLQLSYTGKDQALGRLFVAFYSERLLKRLQDGLARTRSRAAAPPLSIPAAGELVVVGRRSLWSADRLLPACSVLLLSGLGVMVLIALVELADRSFKSERQMARYLGVPVLGAIPDAGPLVRALPEQGSP